MHPKDIPYKELEQTLDSVEDQLVGIPTWMPDALLDIRNELEFARKARAFLEILEVAPPGLGSFPALMPGARQLSFLATRNTQK